MTCIEAEPHVSAVCDGEPIPAGAAEHISSCAVCRSTLAEYTHIGTELRIAAAVDSEPLSELDLPQRRHALDILWHRVAVPRFALAGLLVAIFVAAASVPLVRAQQRPLWFQFGYTLDPGAQILHYRVAKPGFDETGASMTRVNGVLFSTALRIRIESVSSDDVVLRCRAVLGTMEPTGNDGTLRPPHELRLNGTSPVHYKPGQQLSIPIEGGGTVYLRGDVYEQQPKIAFGLPLEPPSNELVMRSPVLTSEGELLAELAGSGAIAQAGSAVTVHAGSHGSFLFALDPFPGAVQGQIEWGLMTFTVDNRPFKLVASAPLAGGEQPRPVWVRHDFAPIEDSSIGVSRLEQ
jgi:hypothetical protein